MSETPPSLDRVVATRIAERGKLDANIVHRALELMAEGCPVPYLARYRLDEVGGLDEHALRRIRSDAARIREFEQRREFILRAMSERLDVPEKLRRRVERCRDRVELEYLYEPFRPPRKTPASLAREQGLEPLADLFLHIEEPNVEAFFGPDRGVATREEALHGAKEILAERFAVDPEVRGTMLRVIEKEGVLGAAPAHGKQEIPDRYANFRTYEERLSRVPSHRFLALHRAEHEGAVSRWVTFPDEKVLAMIAQRFYPKEPSEAVKSLLDDAAAEALRLMRPAVVEDALRAGKERADREAIAVFRNNLADLLLYPPAGPHRVLGVDPAPRGSIPVACVDERGQHLDHARLKFFAKDPEKVAAARERIRHLVRTHRIRLIGLGNGQGRRQCEVFLRECFAEAGEDAPIFVIVNEVGVGSYASGPIGRSELPALPVPVRSAVSLARRLIDPLPELVKVDPRQIGVGQYQNDVDPGFLRRSLDEVVEHCVNYVGADVNVAPVQQLASICGLTSSVARALVEMREKHGRFRTLAQIRDLPFVSEKAFEYAAGFLRIRGGDDPLDGTGVHPRHAGVVERIAQGLGVEPAELVGNGDLLHGVVAEDHAGEDASPAAVAGVLYELVDAGRDPRPLLELAQRSADVRTAGDLKSGMRLSGRVTNVTNFGAFVDVGVQQDGLVHVSELADRFVKDPTSIVRVGQVVQVRVLGVDSDTGRISLTMKSGRGGGRPRRERGSRPQGRGRPRGRDGDERRESRGKKQPEAGTGTATADQTDSGGNAPAQPPPPEDPVPSDMTEEEYMERKMEELRKRFS